MPPLWDRVPITGLRYHEGMSGSREPKSGRATPYESGGRARQKERTRAALVAALHEVMATNPSPTIEEVARTAGISRTTAYRYFPGVLALIEAAYPEIAESPRFAADGSESIRERVRVVVELQLDIIGRWEPQLRAALWSSLDPAGTGTPLRTGRAIGWFIDATSPLRLTQPDADLRSLAIRLRAVAGVETWVWLTDVASLTPDAAREVILANADAVVRSAIEDD